MLVTMKEILKNAKKQKFAVGAFNVPDLESIRAVISAAEEEQIPVILQHAEVHEDMVPMEIIAPIMLDAAEKASIPVCVHFDHGASFDMCIKAIRLGFTSIMYDASAKEYDANLKETMAMTKIAHAAGVSIEAELGHIFTSSLGGGEGRDAVGLEDYNSADDCYTNPNMAKEFVEKTNVDALAISFGTTHGVYLAKPKLDLNRIKEIKKKIDIPFVMHGGSGVSDEDFKVAINNGICKINYYTYMSMAGGKAVSEFIKSQDTDTIFYPDIVKKGTTVMKENARHAMKIFYNK